MRPFMLLLAWLAQRLQCRAQTLSSMFLTSDLYIKLLCLSTHSAFTTTTTSMNPPGQPAGTLRFYYNLSMSSIIVSIKSCRLFRGAAGSPAREALLAIRRLTDQTAELPHSNFFNKFLPSCGATGSRTPDLLLAKQAL